MNNFVDGKCSQCGYCCGCVLPLSKADIKRLTRYVRKHKVLFTPKESAVLISPLLKSCPFLLLDRKTERCSVYDARPEICRVFNCDCPKGTLPGKIERYQVYDMYELLKELS